MPKTIIKAPEGLFITCVMSVQRFRRGDFGKHPRPRHRDAVVLSPRSEWPEQYRIHVWGDPDGRVTAHADHLNEET